MTSSNHPLVHLFIRPGMTLMRALHLRAKIVVLALALGLPLGWLTGQMLLGAHADLASTRLESAACPLVSRLLSTAELAQFHRGLMGRRLAGDRSVDAELAPLRDGLRTNAASVGELIRSLPELGLSAAWQPVERDLLALASGEGPATAAESFAQHTRIVAAVRELVRRGAEASGLLLDPDAVPFHLMHVAVEPILPWTEALAQLRGRGAAQLRKDQLGAAEIGEIVAQTQLLADASATAESMMAMVVRAGEPAPKGFAEALAASRAFADQAVAMFTGAAPHADPARYFDDGTRAIQAVTAFGRATTDRLEQLLRERASRLQWLWFASLVAGAGTLFAVAYLTLVFFLTSHGAVRVLRAAVAQLAGGDFSSRIRLRKTDELGVVGESLDTMTQHLSEMVADVRSNSTMVAQAGLTLASESKLLAERTESQAATLEETAASVQEVSAGVRRGAEAADAASGRATAVRALAEEGGHAIRSAVASMRDIQSSSQRVQEIVGVIEGLSFRTNLLALNAAVEAARAGEQGRGFAVVASEVRTLASRSAESAREISALIQASVAHVDKGAAQIDAASRTFEDIVSGIREVAERVHEIKVSSAEQSGGLDQVSDAVRHIDEITQQNVKMVEAAFHNSSQLSQRADSLAAAVASFKLRQGSADEALALTRRGVALYRQHGPGALPMITDKAQQLCDRDMYVFAFDRQGVYRAFAGNAAKVGTAVKDNPGVDGEKLVRDAFAQAERGGGWVDYDFRNPQTGAVDRKTSYVEGVAPDLIVGCGVYKSRGAPTVAKAAPAIAVAGRAEQRTRQKARASAVAA